MIHEIVTSTDNLDQLTDKADKMELSKDFFVNPEMMYYVGMIGMCTLLVLSFYGVI